MKGVVHRRAAARRDLVSIYRYYANEAGLTLAFRFLAAAPRSRRWPRLGPVPRREYPWWVKLGMWGVPGRAGLWAFVAISLALAVGCVVYGFWDRRFFAGSLFVISALMYRRSIQWVDRHGSWEPEA